MYANTTMLQPATSRRRTPMCWVIAKPTGVLAGVEGTGVSTVAPPAAAHLQTTPFTDQMTAAAANGVTAGLRTRRRPPA